MSAIRCCDCWVRSLGKNSVSATVQGQRLKKQAAFVISVNCTLHAIQTILVQFVVSRV